MSEKIERLDANLAELEAMAMESLATTRSQWALRYGLLESIQIVIDLSCEIAVRLNLGSPATYRECIGLLVRHGYLPGELGTSLSSMVGLRNLLVHDYDEIDPARLTPLLARLDDFREFARLYQRAARGDGSG